MTTVNVGALWAAARARRPATVTTGAAAPTAPLLVTDQDVLTAIASDDSIASDVDAMFKSLATPAPAATLQAWQTDLAAYQAWAADARTKASGGFFFGAWFGVPDLYNAALAWGARLKAHAADASALGAATPTMPELPPPSTPSGLPGFDPSTKLLLGAAIVGIIVLAVRR
jgi:hypothetical protein